MIDDYKKKEEEMTRVGKDWEDAMRMLERELQKRDENLEDKTRKLSVALKEI